LVKGKFTQAENVAYRKDMAIINLAFNEGQIPMGYKMRLNEYLSTIRSVSAEGEGKAPSSGGEAPANENAFAGGEAAGGNSSAGGEDAAVKSLGEAAPGKAAPAKEAPAPLEKPAVKPAAGGKS
jgi:hypothetical protein